MSEIHAELSPSSSERWMTCPGSVVLEAFEMNADNDYAAEGTAAHEYASLWLGSEIPPLLPWRAKNGIVFDNEADDRLDAIREYVAYVRTETGVHNLLIEQKLELSPFTGEVDAEGTADAVIVSNCGSKLTIIDLKFGLGVKVEVKNNSQLMLYALCALRQFDMLGDFKKVKLVVHQPRLEHIDEWTVSIKALKKFEAKVVAAALEVEKAKKSNSLNGFLHPSEKGCKFCKAKAKCPALSSLVSSETGADFDDLSQTELQVPVDLPKAMSKIESIEQWCKAVRAKVESELFSGHKVAGYKLVEGKRGNRDWIDETQAEQQMKALQLTEDEMYARSLLSPAKMEKKLKAQPKKWISLSELITQKAGKPSVAPESDPRPPLELNPEKDFDDLKVPEFLQRKQPVSGE